MSDQPTTGERWTHSWLGQPVDPSPLTEAIAEHHEAALTAEREKYQDARNLWNVAEGESHKGWIQQMQRQFNEVRQLSKQLAAERELLTKQIEATTAARLRASEAEQQLAAEREKHHG